MVLISCFVVNCIIGKVEIYVCIIFFLYIYCLLYIKLEYNLLFIWYKGFFFMLINNL